MTRCTRRRRPRSYGAPLRAGICSRDCSTGCTAFGSALPLLRFITCPTKNAIELGLTRPEARHLIGVGRKNLFHPGGKPSLVAHLNQSQLLRSRAGVLVGSGHFEVDPLGGLMT